MIAATREQARRVARLQRLVLLATRREERQAREPTSTTSRRVTQR